MDLWSNNPAMGAGIGGGMSGGVIIMPKKLHEENLYNLRYAPSLQNTTPHNMNPGETKLLMRLLRRSREVSMTRN